MLIRHVKIIETFNTLKNMQKTSSHRLILQYSRNYGTKES